MKPTLLLRDILKLKKDLEKYELNLAPGLAGMYGELLVWQELEKRFGRKYKVKFVSGQGKADFILESDKGNIKIEVKTSRLKDEGFGLWYGAALNIKRCNISEHSDRYIIHKKKGKIIGDFCYFNYLIFVKLNDDFKAKFYIFETGYLWKNLKLLTNTHPRFNNSTSRIILSNGKLMPKLNSRQLRLIKEMEKYRNKWSVISKI